MGEKRRGGGSGGRDGSRRRQKKKKIIPFRQKLGYIRPFPEPIESSVLGASILWESPEKRAYQPEERL